MPSGDIAMLAARDCIPSQIRFPLYGSIKYDGVRCLVKGGIALSRSNIRLPNRSLQVGCFRGRLNHLDGELIMGDPTAPDCFAKTMSAVMSQDGSIKGLKYYVFDYIKDESIPFVARYRRLQEKALGGELPDVVVPVRQFPLTNLNDLDSAYESVLAQGHEGMILRSGEAPYKRGRGTLRKQDMMKLKPRTRAEARIVGFEELMHNGNPAFVGERGQTKRSSHQENQVPMDTLGKFLVVGMGEHFDGVAFKIGSFKGLTEDRKKQIWLTRKDYVGKIVSYEFSQIGVVDLPRQPTFQGFRDPIDL